LKTPLYEMGVQGIFTKSLDIALLNNTIDIAVHSMKDVPTQLPKGIVQSAVLKRGPVNDLLVYKGEWRMVNGEWLLPGKSELHIATSSIRRKAQWLHRYPHHTIENLRGNINTRLRKAQWLNKYPTHQIHNLRGNVNTRLRKLQEENRDAIVVAQAGLERINLRPENSIVLDWMLPAPAQGAIMVVCRDEDRIAMEACQHFNDEETALCTKIERDFLRALLGGCSTPISALAVLKDNQINFQGNILSVDGKEKVTIELNLPVADVENFGIKAAGQLLKNGGQSIANSIRNAAK